MTLSQQTLIVEICRPFCATEIAPHTVATHTLACSLSQHRVSQATGSETPEVSSVALLMGQLRVKSLRGGGKRELTAQMPYVL